MICSILAEEVVYLKKDSLTSCHCIQVGKESSKVVDTELDAIQLSIFSHRFMSTAEQMGRYLGLAGVKSNVLCILPYPECFNEHLYLPTSK